mgnify:CR=1 FL=1
MERNNQSSSRSIRKARTRTLIQLGGLIEKAGLLEKFSITVGSDLQKEEEIKDNVAALMGSLLEISKQVDQGDLNRTLLISRGNKAFS